MSAIAAQHAAAADVDEEEAKKKAEAKLAQSGPDDKKKQKNQEVMQELAPNPELARRNKELEERLRDVTTIIVDKTGTLTKNMMTVTRFWGQGALLDKF